MREDEVKRAVDEALPIIDMYCRAVEVLLKTIESECVFQNVPSLLTMALRGLGREMDYVTRLRGND